jgi:glycosyltransferase involved in cell wall biosynthesis
MDKVTQELELSIVMPCLNEAQTLSQCIRAAKSFLEKNSINGEIVVADNGSTDNSKSIALKENVKIVNIEKKGYGSALLGGIDAADGKYVIMGDADCSYDFSELNPFVEKLRDGYDLVMGNRFKGGVAKGAMPFLHQYLGNPVLSWVGKLFFNSPVNDFHCGLRGFNKSSIDSLDLQTTGMEFASEMVVKATLNNLKITEVPTTLSPDGRDRAPHLNTWRDGWRHLRFLLLYSPRWLFLFPGSLLASTGFFLLIWLSVTPMVIGGITLDVHTMVYASAFMILGLQMIFFALFAKVFTITHKLLPHDERVSGFMANFTLEKGIVMGTILVVGGVLGSIYAIIAWSGTSFGNLVPTSMMRLVIPSATAIIAGAQFILGSFFLSILTLPTRKSD